MKFRKKKNNAKINLKTKTQTQAILSYTISSI